MIYSAINNIFNIDYHTYRVNNRWRRIQAQRLTEVSVRPGFPEASLNLNLGLANPNPFSSCFTS
jgi:hypothetical protein